MKNIKTIKRILIIGVILINVNIVHSQLNQVFVAGNWFGRTNTAPGPNVSAIGIGNYITSPLSAFHINTNLLPTSTVFTSNQVFRTTSLTDGYWKMFTGTGNGTERFRIYTQPNPFNVFFETTTQNAIFGIRTGNIGTAGLRFLVNGQASINATAGRIATNFS